MDQNDKSAWGKSRFHCFNRFALSIKRVLAIMLSPLFPVFVTVCYFNLLPLTSVPSHCIQGYWIRTCATTASQYSVQPLHIKTHHALCHYFGTRCFKYLINVGRALLLFQSVSYYMNHLCFTWPLVSRFMIRQCSGQ